MPETILLTGASGLIGGRFLRQLSSNSDRQVICLSRSQRDFHTPSNVSSQVIDWTDVSAIEVVCARVDTIVHLAGMNAPEAETDPERAMMERSLLTLRLVNASIAAGIKRFIYISSAKVYGLNLTGMVDEDTPVRPINHYAITHHTAESYILAAHNKKVFDGIVLRLSNGLGVPVTPDVDCWGIIANDFCKQAVETRCIEMTGTGEAKRNFIPMSGVVDTLCFALDVPRDVIKDGLFNLGGASAMKIIELAKLISNRCERLFGFKPEILHAAHTPGEVYPELNYTSKKLVDSGFAPQSDITQEIDDILRLCKVNLATTSNVEI